MCINVEIFVLKCFLYFILTSLFRTSNCTHGACPHATTYMSRKDKVNTYNFSVTFF